MFESEFLIPESPDYSVDKSAPDSRRNVWFELFYTQQRASHNTSLEMLPEIPSKKIRGFVFQDDEHEIACIIIRFESRFFTNGHTFAVQGFT